MSKVAVLGTGYVGLSTITAFAHYGHDVIGVDIDDTRIESLNNGEVPIYEKGLEELLAEGKRDRLINFTTDYRAIGESEFIFLCVPTPQDEDGSADLSFISKAVAQLSKIIKPHSIVINKSTVPIGTFRLVQKLLSENGAPQEVKVVSNPEFLREGSAIKDSLNPARIVIGCDSKETMNSMLELYSNFDAPIVATDPESAEMIKYASNTFLACKISFINEMSRLTDAYGGDVLEVSRGMGLDPRIGNDFLTPGPGYGGSCFPKDTSALLSSANLKKVETPIIEAIISSNEKQFDHVVETIENALRNTGLGINDSTIAVWGLAFKSNTDDVRKSPACEIIRRLQNRATSIVAYDPQAIDNAKKVMSEIEFAQTKYDALDGRDALVLLTEWQEFIDADFQKVKELLKNPIIIDARNILDSQMLNDLGFKYYGLGRG